MSAGERGPDGTRAGSSALVPVGGGHAGEAPARKLLRSDDDAPGADDGEVPGAGAEAMDAAIAARDHDAGASQATRLEQGLVRLPPG